MNRRSFIKNLFAGTIGGWILAFIGGILAFLKMPERETAREKEIEVGEADAFKIGEGRFIAHVEKPFWIIKSEGGFIALSAICTHLKCIVHYNKEKGIIECPCHLGIFDLNGNVIEGPPPKPLKRYEVQIKGGNLYVIME